MSRHDSGQRTRIGGSDIAITFFYFLVPFVLIWSRGPLWAALVVGIVAAAIGFWRN